MSLFALFIYSKKEHKSMTKNNNNNKKIKKSDEQYILNKPKVL